MDILQLIVTSLGPLSLLAFLSFIYLVNRGKLPASGTAKRDENAVPLSAE